MNHLSSLYPQDNKKYFILSWVQKKTIFVKKSCFLSIFEKHDDLVALYLLKSSKYLYISYCLLYVAN